MKTKISPGLVRRSAVKAVWLAALSWLLPLCGTLHAQMTIDTVITNGLHEPYGVVVDDNNLVYIADSINHRIARFDPATGVLLTLAGTPGTPGNVDGPSYAAQFNSPKGLALASIGGALGVIVADTANHTIRFVRASDGLVTTLAGTGSTGSNDAAVGTSAKFRFPIGLSLDNAGILYVADSKNNRIRQVDLGNASYPVTTLNVTNTVFNEPNAVAVVSNARIWVADTRRHAIKEIIRTSATTAMVTNLMGSDNPNTSGSTDSSFGGLARFNNPRGLLWMPNVGLVIADTGNQTLRLATNYAAFGPTNYAVMTIAGIPGQSGFVSGPAASAKLSGPHGLARDVLGNGVYIAEQANNAIRRLQTSPTQPPVADPQIGWVDFVVDLAGDITSVLRTDQPFVFNNDQIIAILAEPGTETFFTKGTTPPSPFEDTIPSPGRNNGDTPVPYRNGLHPSEVGPSIILPEPDVTVKAIGIQDGRRGSAVTSARFQFKVANPGVTGDNAAAFAVNEVTTGSQVFYTLDGTEPTNGTPSLGPISGGSQLSLNFDTDTLAFKARGFKVGYKPSETLSKIFYRSNYVPNQITFGFESGEASSDFVASPGQFFYAPVTLSILPNTKIYSLQFNISVTNLGSAPPVAPGAVGFQSTLIRPDPAVNNIWWVIPPSMALPLVTNYTIFTNQLTGLPAFTNLDYVTPTNPPPTSQLLYPYPFASFRAFLDLRFVDTNNNANILGVGWLERFGFAGLYDTIRHDLIKYSQPHDTIFDKENRRIVPGGYRFQVPLSAKAGDQYRILIDRISATSDGVGAPGSGVYILSPSTGSLAGGKPNGAKYVSIGQRKYLVGDAAPFRWFNAGDFGDTNLFNDDVMQVFQAAVYKLNAPLAGSDMFDAMDSCCGTYAVAQGVDYLVPSGNNIPNDSSRNPLFDGSDQNIDLIGFGDGSLDITDVYVTFRRSLDAQLAWFQRFHTNGARVARQVTQSGVIVPPPPPPALNVSTAPVPEVRFHVGEGIGAAGGTVFVPVSVSIKGTDPLRMVLMNISVEALDGSPALVNQVQFAPSGALGAPSVVSTRAVNNYAAAWLNRAIAGLSGEAQLGYLQITLPTNAPANAAYAIHFDHASGSPNGLASFRNSVGSGLVTRSDRSASSFNDGIPDSWRLRHFGTAYNILSQAGADADGDRANNWQEFKAGTNPNDSSSLLKLKSPRGQGQTLSMQWPSVLNKQYVIERAPSIYSSTWTPVSTNNGTGWDLEYQDSTPGGGGRFYRVRLLQ